MKTFGNTQLKTFLRYLNIMPETAQKVADNLGNYLAETRMSAVQIAKQIQKLDISIAFVWTRTQAAW
jgi:hypothetical protein